MLFLKVSRYRELKKHISIGETSPDGYDERRFRPAGQGYFTFDPDDVSKFRIGEVHGVMDCRIVQYGEFERVEFSWKGKSGSLLASGRGWTGMRGERLEGRLFIHDGEDFGFVAVRIQTQGE